MKKIVLLVSLMVCAVLAADSAQICPFCTEEVIDRQLFYRGQEVLGILTHKPAVKGHVLIIPERHVERFEDLTSSEIAEMGETIKKVDAVIRRLYGTTGYLLVQKNGREAGQSVPHVHFHYLPCSQGASQLVLAIKFLTSPYFKPLSAEEMASTIAELHREIDSQNFQSPITAGSGVRGIHD